MENTRNKKLLWGIGIYLAVLFFILWVTNIEPINHFFSYVLFILRPVLIGLVIAYLCNPIFNLFERKLFYKIWPHGLRRALALFCAYFLLFLIVVLLLLLIFPQLIDSILNFIENSGAYFETTCSELNVLIQWINGILPKNSMGEGLISYLSATKLQNAFSEFLLSFKLDPQTLLGLFNADTLSAAGDVLIAIADTVLGFFISIYLLATKEKRYAQVMRFRRAFLSDKVNDVITSICTTADVSFGGFIRGKLLDSAIIGVLVYLAISLFNVPYAILIAVTIAITDIVPIIGPFVGVVPSAIIILLTDPAKVIPFLICILIIQQFDGNILAPKVLGEQTGISSLCVLIAITTMGALWGFVGMIVGVPLFATVLELTKRFLDDRLKKKGLSTVTDDYYTPDGGEPSLTEISDGEDAQATSAITPFLLLDGRGNLTEKERKALERYQAAKTPSEDSSQPPEKPPQK